MENLFTHYTDSSAGFPSFPIVQHNCRGSWEVSLSLFHSFTMLPDPPLLVAIQDPPCRRSVLPTFPEFMSFTPPPSWPPTGCHLCFAHLEPALVLLNRFLPLLGDAFS